MVLGRQRGAERFAWELLWELARLSPSRIRVLANRRSGPSLQRLVGPDRCMMIPATGDNRLWRLTVQALLGHYLAKKCGAQLYVSTSAFPPLAFRCPVAAFVYDLMFMHFPEVLSPWERRVRTVLLRSSLPRLDAVFTISQATAQDIMQRFGSRLRGPVFVVPCGVDQSWLRRSEVEPDEDADLLQALSLRERPFVLTVLGGKRYKNQAGAAAVAARLARDARPMEVVVVGDGAAVMQTLGCPRNVRLLGVVSDEMLAALYRNARVFLFPTFFEGFGIPVIEAQAAGTPVVCSDLPVLREVAGQGAIFVDPRSPDAMAEAVRAAAWDRGLRERLVEEGRENAARFTWSRAAESFLAACERLAPAR